MRNIILICTIILFLSSSCGDKIDNNFPGTYPCCLQSTLDNLISSAPTQPRAKLEKFYYKGQYVYSLNFVPPYPEDFLYSVVGENCEIICSYGGIANLKCAGWEEAEFIEVVWEDER